MATNIDVTLKRYNGTDYDVILPVTHLGQLYTDSNLTTTLATYLGNTYIALAQRGAANGVATLDANAKITASQLPDYVVGGMRFIGAIFSSMPYGNLNTNPALSNMANVKPGSYFVVANTDDYSFTPATVDMQTETQIEDGHIIINPGDEGDTESPIRLEQGDWLVYLGYDDESLGFFQDELLRPSYLNTDEGALRYRFSHKWAVINNTYQNATDTEKGIVQLTDITSLASASGNDVVTEGILAGLVETDEADMSGTDGAFAGIGANLIAPARHTHDNRYYTKTAVQNFFSGNTAITGYNKTNWDTAYGWGNHADEGYLTEESLADLTDVSLTSLAEHNILRYNGTNWVNDATFKPILYGASFTTGDGVATITGTLCIEST